jgi:hypothetical protein
VRVKEIHVERKIRLIYPTRRGLSHAAKAFLEVVGERAHSAHSAREEV